MFLACSINCAISIHAPREGGDSKAQAISTLVKPFQSTPPARGATGKANTICRWIQLISIHAPREGGD